MPNNVILKLSQNKGGVRDDIYRRMTLIFGHTTAPSAQVTLCAKGESPMVQCERTHIFFPEDRIKVDAYGRKVGDKFVTRRNPWQ